MDEVKLQNLITRLENMRGPHMGDGINPGFTTTEVLDFLYDLCNPICPVHKGLGKICSCCYTLDRVKE